MDPFRTPQREAPATSTPAAAAEPRSGVPGEISPRRSCAACCKPIRGRASKKCCSGACRIALCRQRRHGILLMRLQAAEEALARAAEAVAVLRVFAEMGPHVTASLAIGGSGA